MKVLSALVVLAAVTLGAVHAEQELTKVGIPESYTAPKTALGNPIHLTALGSHGRSSEGTVGVPVSFGHPRHHKKFSASSSSSDGDSDVEQREPHAHSIVELMRLYGKLGKHDKAGSSDLELPTPAPTTYVTPAPTVPQIPVSPAPTKPSFRVTPSPTVPTSASTTTSDESPDTVQPDTSNMFIKQMALPTETPTETPAATLAVESPTPTTELLRNSDAVGTALSVTAASSESSESSVALPVAVLGCVAAALAVAAAVFVQKKRKTATSETTVDVDTTSPSFGVDVHYKNDMVTPV
ncbi:hypothetical protein PybrP1_004667 [[Pythium] brassicae (nom. inval.)]|nr:hypothetical protein PybrP1_004667 [[Pythium] brassicae (nom. inval.)]